MTSWNHFLNQPGGYAMTLVGVIGSSLLGLWFAGAFTRSLERSALKRWPRAQRQSLAVVLGMFLPVACGVFFFKAMAGTAPGPVNAMAMVNGPEGQRIVVHFAVRGETKVGLASGSVSTFRVNDGARTAALDLSRWGQDLSLVRVHNNLALGRVGNVHSLYDYATLRPIGDLAVLAAPHLPGALSHVDRFTATGIKLVTKSGYARWVRFDRLLGADWDGDREVQTFSPAMCHLSRIHGVSLPAVDPDVPLLGLTGENQRPCTLDTPEGALTIAFAEDDQDEGAQRKMYGLVDSQVQWVRNIDDWVASNESFELLAPEVTEEGLRFYWLRAGLSLSRYNLDPMSGTLNGAVTYF